MSIGNPGNIYGCHQLSHIGWRRCVPSSVQSVSFESDDHKKVTKLPTASDSVRLWIISVLLIEMALRSCSSRFLDLQQFSWNLIPYKVASANSWCCIWNLEANNEPLEESFSTSILNFCGVYHSNAIEASFHGLLEACGFGHGHVRPISNIQNTFRFDVAEWREKRVNDMIWPGAEKK